MMDPNSPAPAPTPEQTPTPSNGPVPVTPPPTPGSQPPKKLSTGAIAGIVGGAVFIILLIIGGIVLATTMNKDDNKSNDNKTDSSKTEDEGALRSANAVTADSMSDLAAVCKNGSVKNAAAYEKPYKFAIFDNNSARGSWSSFTSSYDNESIVKYADFAQANVITCLDRDDSTAVKSLSCDFKTGGETTSVDFYAVKYKVTLYEAQSGKKVKELAAINGPATKCPSFVTYDKSNPKIYGEADKAELDTVLAAFAG